MQPSNCRNCEQAVAAGFDFCPHCGQTMHIHRINAHHLAHEVFHFFTHSDKGILQLLKWLLVKPGEVARQYIEGKRKSIFSPINFFLIVAGILVIFSTSFQPTGSNSRVAAMRQAASNIKNPQAKKNLLSMADRTEKAMNITSKYANLVSMLATPLMTFFLWLFYIRRKYNYTEHLVANMYIVGFTLLVYALVFIPLNALTNFRLSMYVLVGFFLFEIIYRTFAYYHFIQNYSAAGKIKALAASVFVVMFWIALTVLLINYYIRNGLWGLFT